MRIFYLKLYDEFLTVDEIILKFLSKSVIVCVFFIMKDELDTTSVYRSTMIEKKTIKQNQHKITNQSFRLRFNSRILLRYFSWIICRLSSPLFFPWPTFYIFTDTLKSSIVNQERLKK